MYYYYYCIWNDPSTFFLAAAAHYIQQYQSQGGREGGSQKMNKKNTDKTDGGNTYFATEHSYPLHSHTSVIFNESGGYVEWQYFVWGSRASKCWPLAINK